MLAFAKNGKATQLLGKFNGGHECSASADVIPGNYNISGMVLGLTLRPPAFRLTLFHPTPVEKTKENENLWNVLYVCRPICLCIGQRQ